ncbi:hypothetical protein NH340_JMT03855 [Sarcoptes scabiei]|nr:hypothetical protein NH340_JMT03855 [Sarcoptes scabiei]
MLDNLFKMVPLVSFLAALRILTEAQICNNGEGKIVFEKVTTLQTTSTEFLTNTSQFEIITRNNLPPLKVLEECFHRCQEDRVNKIGTCTRFDFLPGKRLNDDQSSVVRKRRNGQTKSIASFSPPQDRYEQSSCILYNGQANGTVDWKEISKDRGSVWQFNKACLIAQHINKQCPNRPFVYERIPNYKLINTDEKNKEIEVVDRIDCQNKCLMEQEFTCRSSSFKLSDRKCFLSTQNRHVAPMEFKEDPEFEYLENMCLKNEDLCRWSILIIESKKQLDEKFEKNSLQDVSMNNCSNSCLESLDRFGFVCRSFVYNDQTRQCILYDEDPMDNENKSEESVSKKLIESDGNLYRVLCSTNEKDKELDNQTLECYRHKRLRGRHQSEQFANNFYDCLNGCMRRFGRNCRSIEFSHSRKICRFSTRSVVGPVSNLDTDVLIDDDSFDYYQFMWDNKDEDPNEINQQLKQTNDRHDSIETSYSQPGNYKNFLLPSNKPHRVGYFYNNQFYNDRDKIDTNYRTVQQKIDKNLHGFNDGPVESRSSGPSFDRPSNVDFTATPPTTSQRPDYDTHHSNSIEPLRRPLDRYITDEKSQSKHPKPSFGTTISRVNERPKLYHNQDDPSLVTQQKETEFSDQISPVYPSNSIPERSDSNSIPSQSTDQFYSNGQDSSYYYRSGDNEIVRPNHSPNVVYPSSNYIYHQVEQQQQSPIEQDNNLDQSFNVPISPRSGSIPSRTSYWPKHPYMLRTTNNIVYPSPNYTYQIGYQRPENLTYVQHPLSNYKPNRFEQTTMIQSPIYSVPNRSHTQIYSIHYPNQIRPTVYPTPTQMFHGRSFSTVVPTTTNQSFILNPPSQTFTATNDYTRNLINSPYTSFANYTRFLSPGSLRTMSSQLNLPQQPIQSTSFESYPKTQIAYTNRFGQLPPSQSSRLSFGGQEPIPTATTSITSPGCKHQSISMVPTFKKMGLGLRIKSKHIYKVARAERLEDCERFCLETKDFVCNSFNFRPFFPDNCELSTVVEAKYKLDDVDHFEQNTQFEHYVREEKKSSPLDSSMDCFEVLQSCSPEGMELKLKTTEGFYGRIYTYGFYDSCYFNGNGGTTSVLKISKPNGFPRCGTQQINPDAMTNIVVVQFNDFVQTSRDKKYNITCYLSGPGEAVVTSNYLDTKTDGRHPMQIEHLPAQNILASNIALRIFYRGTPTNTIVVGDLLTFRLEARNQYRYNGYYNDIFATNVIAKDPYTGRQVLLIDSKGCPIDLYVFPELHKTVDDALEAEFYAFKIPDSNFLVFQATVKTCKGQCEPVICNERAGRGQGTFPSWGRKRRSIENSLMMNDSRQTTSPTIKSKNNGSTSMEEEVHELLRVYLSHDDVPEQQMLTRKQDVQIIDKLCVDRGVYYFLLIFTILFMLLFIIILPYCILIRWMNSRYQNKINDDDVRWMSKWKRMSLMIRKPSKFQAINSGSIESSPSSSLTYERRFDSPINKYSQPKHHHNRTQTNNGHYHHYQISKSNLNVNPDDQNLSMERSRSLQSLTIPNQYKTAMINYGK